VKNKTIEVRPSLTANLLKDSPALVIVAFGTILGLIVVTIGSNVWLALAMLVLISLGFTLRYYILLHSFVLTVNDTAVQIRLGWLSHTTSTINLRKMESTALHQSLMGRFMNYGRIEFKGTGGTSDFSPTIENPAELKAEIERRMEAKVV
jgi:uncharacterized membrane protein YdbT with pleckstrin-like domain